jgi:23S rRNA G2069 N7-methylase RlmK/C1962 C5-methylase RlmI
VKPDFKADFTALPFADESFKLVVFDPPHLIRGGDSSWLVKKYGRLPKEYGPVIKDGFSECMRVLEPFGVLIFKWCEDQIRVSEIIETVGRQPLFGHKSGKAQKTHWLCFMKGL